MTEYDEAKVKAVITALTGEYFVGQRLMVDGLVSKWIAVVVLVGQEGLTLRNEADQFQRTAFYSMDLVHKRMRPL